MIEQWLASLKVGPRSRNNYRASVVTLFHYARKHGYLPREKHTEADLVDKVKDRGKKIEILTPPQLAKLMADPPTRERLIKLSLEPLPPSTPDSFAAYIGTEVERWAVIVKNSGAELE